MVWIKRSVFTYAFKGRPRRGLFWSKKVYKLWFDFAKQSPRNVPAEFGNLSKFHNFEEWWRHPEYGFELFCEPVEEPSFEIVTSTSDTAPDHIYLKMNLNEEPQKLKRLFEGILKKQQRNKKIKKKSKARFKPSINQKYIKLEALKDYFEIYKLRNAGFSRKETYEKHYQRKWEEYDEDSLRNISRACQRVNEIFKSIEKGTFP